MRTIDLTSAFRGITTPVRDLMNEIHARGWTVGKVEFKKGEYHASATNPSGKKVTKTGRDQATALGSLLIAIMRREHVRSAAQRHVGMWKSNWTDQIQEIAEAYATAPAYDPKAGPAWKELANDSVRRMEVLAQQIDIEIVDDPEPYSSSQEMCEDVHNKRKCKVSRANSEHPIWSVDENVAFRVVHDVLGHCVSGGDFGWVGENQACAAHFPLLSPLAQQALFSECIAQTAYSQYYRAFGPQKIVLLPQFLGEAQYAENDVDHTGVPVEHSYAPMAMPEVAPSPAQGLDLGTTAPHEAEEMGWPEGWYDYEQGFPRPPVISKTVTDEGQELFDPNHQWESGIAPADRNAYLHYGDPLDYGKEGGIQDVAQKLQGQPLNKMDESLAKASIANALRAAVLSPMKNLRWNAIQYQHLMQIPYDVTDPSAYHDALNDQRVKWNVSKFGPDFADVHIPYREELKDLIGLKIAQHPDVDPSEVRKNTELEVHNLLYHYERTLEGEESDKAEDKRKSADQITAAAAALVKTHLRDSMKAKNERHDVEHEQLGLIAAKKPKFKQVNKDQKNLLNDEDPLPAETGDDELYGGWLIQQTKNIAAISRHIDSLYDAAVEDANSGGKGHIFRTEVMHLNLPGVGPKVASFAWLLLSPTTSELATIDTHMISMLGGKQSDLSNRDYFKYERMLRARTDNMGYGSMPLGQAQWALWDAKRTGVGSHQDHTALKPMNPTPHDQVDWAKKDPTETRDWSKKIEYEADEEGNHVLDRGRPNQTEGPEEWWANSEDAGKVVEDLWNANEASQHSRSTVPFRTANIFPTFIQSWQKLRPISGTVSQIKQLASYAVLNKTPKKKITEYMDKHRDDFRGGELDWKMFKKALRKEIDQLQTPPGWKGSSFQGQRPYYLSDAGDVVEGQDGDSIMKHLRRDLKLSPEELWKLNLDVGRT
jgi:hypothetical protein